jgi:hypothetical protein
MLSTIPGYLSAKSTLTHIAKINTINTVTSIISKCRAPNAEYYINMIIVRPQKIRDCNATLSFWGVARNVQLIHMTYSFNITRIKSA